MEVEFFGGGQGYFEKLVGSWKLFIQSRNLVNFYDDLKIK